MTTTTTATPKHGTEALDAMQAINDALDAYSKVTGGRWALKDMQVHEEIEGMDSDLNVGTDEAFLALINNPDVETPSPYGDGQWADANFEGFRDEIANAMSTLNLRWATCDECYGELTPETASPETSKVCKDCAGEDQA